MQLSMVGVSGIWGGGGRAVPLVSASAFVSQSAMMSSRESKLT